MTKIEGRADFAPVQKHFDQAFEERRSAALGLIDARRSGDAAAEDRLKTAYRTAQREIDGARADASVLVEKASGESGFRDTNYIFLSFVTRYLPVGLVGLVIAVILAATMSASSGEINSLATVTVVDLYRRYWKPGAGDHHYVVASRWATLFWGIYGVLFAGWVHKMGALIVAVNKVGSLFYGSLLGCFALALFFKKVRGTATFVGMLCGEAAILATAKFSDVSFLWYNVIGCAVVIAVALVITAASSSTSAAPATPPPA
jgi:Na+/proline symporter